MNFTLSPFYNSETPTPDRAAIEQLITAISDLKETIKNQQKTIYDFELWTLEHIAEHCHLSTGSIRKITANPSFPAPILLNGSLGQKLWHQTQVKQWLNQSQAKLPKPRARK